MFLANIVCVCVCVYVCVYQCVYHQECILELGSLEHVC